MLNTGRSLPFDDESEWLEAGGLLPTRNRAACGYESSSSTRAAINPPRGAFPGTPAYVGRPQDSEPVAGLPFHRSSPAW